MWEKFKIWFIKEWNESWELTKESSTWTVDWVNGDTDWLWWAAHGIDWAISKDMDNTVGDDCQSSKFLNVNTFNTVGTTLDFSAFADVEVAQAA